MENQLKIKKSSNHLTSRVIFSFFLVGFLSLILSGLIIFNNQKNTNFKTIDIAGQQIKLRLAKTPSEQQLGLGYVKKLPENEGMLFIYDNYVMPSYWMKDMQMSIDIIWIKDNMVMGYERDLQPQDSNINLPTYSPKTFINYVLEVNSGFVDKYSLKIGDIVNITL